MLLQRLLSHALEFCYPGSCAICAMPCVSASFLCDDCEGKFQKLTIAPACHYCAKPVPAGTATCPYCHDRGIAPYDSVVRLGVFDDPLKHLIHLMKYQGRWTLGEQLADRLFESETAKALLAHADVLVPVPLHIRRQIERGYNQADVIARRLKKHCKKSLVNAVKRIRATETQTHLHSHEKRLANMRDAFALRPQLAKKIFAKHVVIVDDVTTSGATLKAVGYVLKQAAPASLSALVLAVADPKGRSFEAI